MDSKGGQCDVLVIGAGPSGGVVSNLLAQAGLKVTCLEQGDWVSSSDFPSNNAEWQLQIQAQWAHHPNVRKNPADYPLAASDSDLEPVMFNAVGGSTIQFGAWWPRLLPSDLKVRSFDGVADDWPLSYEELSYYYDRSDRMVGVAGLGGNPAYPGGLDFPLPPHPIGKAGEKMAHAMNRLGWHWWPGTNAIPSSKFRDLAQCDRWGTCEWGCPRGAKASADLVFWTHGLRSGASLVTGARVHEILVGADGYACGARWVDVHGKEHKELANAVVVCANGIGTARLLLNSRSNLFPDGLANSSGLIGKNLMLHPNCAVMGVYEDELDSFIGPAGHLINSLEFHESQGDHIRGSTWGLVGVPGPLNVLEFHRVLPFDQVWGRPLHDIVEHHSRSMLWAANTDDLPEESNTVTLDSELTDTSGMPAPKITYRISENTRKILDFTVDRMIESHAEAGADRIVKLPLLPDQPGHLLGTARMGLDPKTSVVDPFGRAHDVPNLFIADGSIFVTGGSANPTCTIHALALRVAEHIISTATEAKVTT